MGRALRSSLYAIGGSANPTVNSEGKIFRASGSTNPTINSEGNIFRASDDANAREV